MVMAGAMTVTCSVMTKYFLRDKKSFLRALPGWFGGTVSSKTFQGWVKVPCQDNPSKHTGKETRGLRWRYSNCSTSATEVISHGESIKIIQANVLGRGRGGRDSLLLRLKSASLFDEGARALSEIGAVEHSVEHSY